MCSKVQNTAAWIMAVSWVVFWLALGVLALISPAHGTTAKIGVFVDSEDISAADAMRLIEKANDIFQQSGVRLEFDSWRLVKPSLHANPAYVLDDVIQQRMELRDSATADVYVLLTRGGLYIGSMNYAGYATKGPACTVHQSAVVHVLGNPEEDARTLAHEIAHTFGVEHDHTVGWLMAPAAHQATDVMSPDTLGVIKGSLLDCMQDKPVQTVAYNVQDEPAGGGGSLHVWFLAALLAVAILAKIK